MSKLNEVQENNPFELERESTNAAEYEQFGEPEQRVGSNSLITFPTIFVKLKLFQNKKLKKHILWKNSQCNL